MAISAGVLDQADLAWAAGFFDGERSTIARTFAKRPGYYQLNVTVPQAGHRGIPEVLDRFQSVMLGMGHISGPNLVLQLLWPHPGEVKRAQATQAISRVEREFAAGTRQRRKAARTRYMR